MEERNTRRPLEKTDKMRDHSTTLATIKSWTKDLNMNDSDEYDDKFLCVTAPRPEMVSRRTMMTVKGQTMLKQKPNAGALKPIAARKVVTSSVKNLFDGVQSHLIHHIAQFLNAGKDLQNFRATGPRIYAKLADSRCATEVSGHQQKPPHSSALF